MNIHTICWARNECDILEAFVRHHVRFSSVHIVLHRCRDNSDDILSALADEGLPVTWRTDERIAHEQAQVMNELMQEAFLQGADWVLPLDADEFLTGDVLSVLREHADAPHTIRVAWKGYVPTALDSLQETNVLKRIQYRRKKESPQWYKMVVPRSCAQDAALCFGNHALVQNNGQPIDYRDTALSIAHFPVRSARQIARKIYGGWLAYCANPDHVTGGCFQWKAAFEILKKGQDVQISDLTSIAFEYASDVQWNTLSLPPVEYSSVGVSHAPPLIPTYEHLEKDPVVCTFAIQYPIQDADPLNVLFENAEDIALAYAALQQQLTEH